MSAATETLKSSMDMAAYCVNAYLSDLADSDLLRRPAQGANHIAWQLGHLISSEHNLTNMVCPDSMPALPEGFAENYTKETAASDNPADFHKKDEYLQLMQQQREATLAQLARISDERLLEPAPEAMRDYAPTVGAVFALQATHWMMHSGQWVIVRRQLGKPALF